MDVGSTIKVERVGYALSSALCLVGLPFLVVTLMPPANHDMAAILHFTERWLGGERLYVDLIDMNPPLIFILSIIPVVLARIFDTDATFQAVLCVHALAIGSAVASSKVNKISAGHRDLTKFLLPPLVIFLVAPLTGPSFGQREHLMVLAALPYLFMASARAEGHPIPRRLAAVITVTATMAFCLKPYFLAIPALIETFLLLRIGWISDAKARPENLPLMASVGFAYAAIIACCFPAYLAQIVPLAAQNYAAEICCTIGKDSLGHFPMIALMELPDLQRAAMFGLPSVLLGLRPGASDRGRIFALATAGALAAGMVQRKGWEYHFIPFEGFLAALCVLLAADLFSPHFTDRRPLRRIGAGIAIMCLFAAGYVHALTTRNGIAVAANYGDSGRQRLVDVMRREAERPSILVLSPGILPFFPAFNYARAKLPSPFMSMWLLQGVYRACLADGRRYREAGEMSTAEAMLFNRIVENFVRSRPALVIVDRRSGIVDCGAPFEFLAYFSRDPRFAKEFAEYRRSDPIHGLDLEIYVRHDRQSDDGS